MTWEVPDPRTFDSLLDLLDDASKRWAGRRQLALRTDEGLSLPWTAADLRHHAKLVAWRLRALGLKPGDRLLTWSPATPALPAVYFGAMYAGVIVVPLDLRMSPETLQRLAQKAGGKWLAIGTGFDAPDAKAAGLDHLNIRTVEALAAEPPFERADHADEGGIDEPFPDDWEAQLDSWPRPTRDALFEVIYTSGTTGLPKGVMLTHGQILSTLEAISLILPPQEERTVSLLPASHLFDQAPILFYGMSIGGDILYLRSRTPRVILKALAEHRVTTMVVVPQLLELFWAGLMREIERQGRTRAFNAAFRIAKYMPYWARRIAFRAIHEQLGGDLRLMASAASYLPPEVQEQWERLGIIVLQGYGATECGPAAATSIKDHPTGTVGHTKPPVKIRLDDSTSEILIGGPTVFTGYWQDPEATAAAKTADGWYRTGDIGRFDKRGNLILSGRVRNVIALPNGLKVFPEDMENVLDDVGLHHSVVLETTPGRIEAVVLPPNTPAVVAAGGAPKRPETPEEEAALKAEIDAMVKQANSRLGQHQRIDGWRLWPEPDFQRTHTLKIKRGPVRDWVGAQTALPIRDAEG